MALTYENPVIDNITGSPTLDSLKSGSDKLNEALEQIKARVENVASLMFPFETSDTEFEVTLDNEGWMFITTSDTPVIVTLPVLSNSTTGQTFYFFQFGEGQISFEAGPGATIYSADLNNTRAQYSVVAAVRTFEDGWTLMGDLGFYA